MNKESKKIPFVCSIFGHKMPTREGLTPYFSINRNWSSLDGSGRHHVGIQATCDRCGAKWDIGRLHLPISPKEFDALWK